MKNQRFFNRKFVPYGYKFAGCEKGMGISMDKETIVVKFINVEKKTEVDLDVPVAITANDLVLALNRAYELGIDVSDIKKCYLQAENPIALLRGNRTLQEFGLRNGSSIYYTNQAVGSNEKQI